MTKIPDTAFRVWDPDELTTLAGLDVGISGYTHLVVRDVSGKGYQVGDVVWVLDLTNPDAEWYRTIVTED